jgi:SAM-dependent methyltransferase
MKSAMSSQDISTMRRLASSWNIFRRHQTGVFGNVDATLEFHADLCRLIKTHLNVPIGKTRILDLGCGQRVDQTILFKADGADVTGIDMEVPTYKMDFRIFTKVIKTNGTERALKSLLRHFLFDRKYFALLASKYDKRIVLEGVDTRIMNAADLAFPHDHFDFIYSSWVFEHIDNVAGAVQEVNRVLKPKGVAWIGIHLFPSLSGGHHLGWEAPDTNPPPRVPPWDHLLENRFPVNTYLNKMRLDEYRQVFAKHIDIESEELTQEGQGILTPALEEALREKGYSKTDLLTRKAIFICTKRNP